MTFSMGCEWVVEALGCEPGKLRDLTRLQNLFEDMVTDLHLHPVGEGTWHRFPGSGGLTGLRLLSESHIACHTFPEYGSLCLNLFCCRERPDWSFEASLQNIFGAREVRVRRIERSYLP